jgi:glycosyltransferase involved in cell wall biosynthesis
VKILVTTFTFPPQASGVSEIARSQACGLAARGHELTVATDFDPGRAQEHSCGKLQIHQFNITGDFDPKVGYHGEIGRYQELIAKGSFDIILCNCWQNWATDLAFPVFRQTQAKKVIVTQGLDAQVWHPYPYFPWGFARWLRCLPYALRLPRVMNCFDQVIFLSHRRDWGRFFDHRLARWFGKRHISILPNGIHLDSLRSRVIDFRTLHGIETPHMLLNVANYCDRKNQIATLRAFIRARRADTTLVFIGSEFNEYSSALIRLWEANPIKQGRVLILQGVPRNQITAAHQAADLFLLQAKAETQPLVILDTMAAGVPFVSTDTGCVSELPGGWVINGEAKTARAINLLLDDPTLRRRLGSEGRAVTEKYSWEHVISAYEALFQRLLRRG